MCARSEDISGKYFGNLVTTLTKKRVHVFSKDGPTLVGGVVVKTSELYLIRKMTELGLPIRGCSQSAAFWDW